MTSRWLLAIRVAVVAAIAALVYRYSEHLDWRALAAASRDASPLLLALACAGNVPLVWLKARRMRILLGRRVSTAPLMSMFFASYAADNLVMSQAGPAVRSAYLARAGEPLSLALGLQALEKVIEGIGLGLVVAPLALAAASSSLSQRLIWAALGLALAGAALTVAALRFRAREDAAVPRSTSRLSQLRARLAEMFEPISGRAALAEVIATTAASWALELLMVMASLSAVDLAVPMIPCAALVLLAVNLASLIPGLPANVGPFETVCVLVTSQFGIPPSHGLAFALLYHASHTLPVTLLGLPALRGLRGARQSSAPSAESSLSRVR